MSDMMKRAKEFQDRVARLKEDYAINKPVMNY